MTLLRAWLLFACQCALFTTSLAAEKPIPTSASSTFPECGIQCSILNSAQDSCVAGAESSWKSCFCESSLLTSLKTSGSLCNNCGTSDQSTVSSWYNSYCKSGSTTNNNNNNNNDKDKESQTTATATSSTSTSTATAASGGSKNATTQENKSWWSTHYQWVIMLIVLVIGFTALAILGVWLKRRYEARHPNLYAPNPASSSGALPVRPGSTTASGVLSPPPAGWAQPGGDSVASSSRTDIAPKGVSQSKLQKGAPTAAADVEIRQLQR